MSPLPVRLAAAALAVAAAAALARTAGERVPTFHREVERILQRNCQACHREGDVGPMPLVEWSDAAAWADDIAGETAARRMPPWKPDRGHGEFVGERRLTEREIDVLARWAAAGAPRGDPADAPKPLTLADGWAAGTPDAVLAYGEPFTPSGTSDVYRCFPVPTDFGEDRWVRAVDIRPGDPSTVHHVILFVDPAGASLLADAAEEGPGYACFGDAGVPVIGALGAWAPGARPFSLDGSTGIRLPAGATVVVQIHYHPHHGAGPDLTQVGLYFHDAPPAEDLLIVPVGRDDFLIPAGDPAHAVESEWVLPEGFGVTVRTVAPHMHRLGRSMSVDAHLPDGTVRSLVRISDWDFDWQSNYVLLRPAPLPGGTRVAVRAVYDNSAATPSNPSSPPVAVGYGESTTDEMGWAFLGVTLGAEGPPPRAPGVRSISVDRRGRLSVRGRGVRRGALLEIDGVPVPDARGGRTLRSAAAWRDLAPGGEAVEVALRNPDGHRSLPVVFVPLPE